MWDFSIAKSLSILVKTWPYLLLRVAVFGAFSAVFLILTASVGLIGHQLAPRFASIDELQGAIFGGMAGMALGGAVIRILREYTLYLVKAGHIAVMVALLDGTLKDGRGQLQHGTEAVKATFAEASVLFLLDQFIKAALKSINTSLNRIGAFIPGLAVLFGIIMAIAETAITFVDEVVLAQLIRKRPANPWQAGADTIVLYAQNGKKILKNAFWLTLFIFVASALVLLTVIGPAALAVQGDPVVAVAAGEAYALVVAIVAAVFVIHVVVEPFAVASLIQVFDQVTAGQQPDPRWEERLADRSPAFRDLRDHVPDYGDGKAAPAE